MFRSGRHHLPTVEGAALKRPDVLESPANQAVGRRLQMELVWFPRPGSDPRLIQQ
jgi:hypothetical protein